MFGTMKRLLLVVSLWTVVAGVAWSRFESTLTVIGFSQDGAYLAFQTTIPYSVTGYAYSSVYVVDVDSNTFAVPPIERRTEGEFTEDELAAAVRTEATANLERFGIVAGNRGERVYLAAEGESWEDLNAPVKHWTVALPGDAGDAELQLEQREIDAPDCETLAAYELPARIVTLTLGVNGEETVLQHDTVLFESRHCPFAYTLAEVYVYENRLAVFLDSHSVGFEGLDVYKLAVTGTMPR